MAFVRPTLLLSAVVFFPFSGYDIMRSRLYDLFDIWIYLEPRKSALNYFHRRLIYSVISLSAVHFKNYSEPKVIGFAWYPGLSFIYTYSVFIYIVFNWLLSFVLNLSNLFHGSWNYFFCCRGYVLEDSCYHTRPCHTDPISLKPSGLHICDDVV